MSKENSENENAAVCIRFLWEDGFFIVGRTLKEVSDGITRKWGHNFSASDISNVLRAADFLIRSGRRRSFQYKQKTSPKSKKIENIEGRLFSADLVGRLGLAFKTEIDDLHLNFGRSGACTAFLLRKILEKMIYLAFAKNGISSKLEDRNGIGNLVGLEAMIGAAAREKVVGGTPFLIPKTAEKIKGIKFLGDTSAHNPLANVDMETILPQMPFIIIAYQELVRCL